MTNKIRPLAVACLFTAVTACSTTSPQSQSEALIDAASKVDAQSRGAERYSISSKAGVEELVREALDHSPAVQAGEAKVRRMLAKVPQAKSLQDPKAKLSTGSMAETAAGRVDAMVGVEQMIPFPGKLREASEAARKEALAAEAALQGIRLEVAHRTRSAYWDYYFARQKLTVTRESRSALEQVRDSVDALVSANKATQNDQLRLAGEFGKVEKALVEAGQAEATATAKLNSLLNRPSGSKLPAPKASGLASKGKLTQLPDKAEREHPSVRAAEAKLASFEHRLKRADLEKYPDFSFGLQHAFVSDSGLAPSANGRDQFFGTLGISIPLWQEPKRAMADEARAGIDESEAELGDARSRLRFRVEDAWLRAKSAEQLITLFDKQILPEAKQSFEVVLTGYVAGKQQFVDVLDAWRNLLAFELQQAGNRAAFGKAIAALKSAVGE